MREETRCHHMGYSFRLAARVLLYASSHRQDNTYHDLCYTSRGALAGTRNNSMGPPWRINLTTHRTMSERSYRGATSRSHLFRVLLVLETLREHKMLYAQHNLHLLKVWDGRNLLLPLHGLLVSSSKGYFICSILRPLLHQSWLEWEIVEWVNNFEG